MLEELGIDATVGLDWVTEEGESDGALLFVYDGGVMTSESIDRIVLPPVELRAVQFVAPSELGHWVSTAANVRRAACALEAIHSGSVIEIDRLCGAPLEPAR